MIYKLSENAELIKLDDGQCVVFDSLSGDTHVLDEIGNAILSLCNGNNNLDTVVAELAAQFDTPADEIMADVKVFLSDLTQKQVLDAVNV